MILAIIFTIIGLILIFLEFYLPGGVMAVLGSLLIFSSILLLVVKQATFFMTGSYLIGTILSFFLIFKLALKKVKSNKDFFLKDDQEGYLASSYNKDLIGKTAVCSSDLNPCGFIEIGNRNYQATSKDSYIEKNQQVEVIAGEGSNLIVKKVGRL